MKWRRFRRVTEPRIEPAEPHRCCASRRLAVLRKPNLANFEPRVGLCLESARREDPGARRFRHFRCAAAALRISIFIFNSLCIRAFYLRQYSAARHVSTGAFHNSVSKRISGLPPTPNLIPTQLRDAVELGIARELTSNTFSSHRLCRLPWSSPSVPRRQHRYGPPTLTPTGYVFPPTATSSTLNPNFGVSIRPLASQFFYHALAGGYGQARQPWSRIARSVHLGQK